MGSEPGRPEKPTPVPQERAAGGRPGRRKRRAAAGAAQSAAGGAGAAVAWIGKEEANF